MAVFGFGLGLHPPGADGGGPERRPLRGARDRHLGGHLLPDDRRVVRHGGVRRHLRQPVGRQRAAGAPPATAPPGFSLSADNPDAIHHLPAAVQAGVIDGHRPHHPDHVPDRRAHRLRGLPAQLDPPRGRAPQVDPHLGAGREPRDSPSPRTSLGEVQRLLERAASRENRGELYEMLATRAGLDLEPAGRAGSSTGWPTGPTPPSRRSAPG